jgi:hypothetical protein
MELRMNRKLLLSAAGAAVAVFMACGTAQAAPATGTLDTLKTLGAEQTNVEPAQYRRRHCRHYRYSHRRCWRRRWY